MKKQTALQTIMYLAIAGMLFSGYLSYTEIFRKTCALGGSCTSIGSVPACVYGFVMYAVVFVVSLLGVKAKK